MRRRSTWYWRIWWWIGYHGPFQLTWWWQRRRDRGYQGMLVVDHDAVKIGADGETVELYGETFEAVAGVRGRKIRELGLFAKGLIPKNHNEQRDETV